MQKFLIKILFVTRVFPSTTYFSMSLFAGLFFILIFLLTYIIFTYSDNFGFKQNKTQTAKYNILHHKVLILYITLLKILPANLFWTSHNFEPLSCQTGDSDISKSQQCDNLLTKHQFENDTPPKMIGLNRLKSTINKENPATFNALHSFSPFGSIPSMIREQAGFNGLLV